MVLVLIRSALRVGIDMQAYQALDARRAQLVLQIPGYLSRKSYAAKDGEEISLFHFESEEALLAWRNQPAHG